MSDVAVDGNGNIYGATGGAVVVYAAGSTGDAAPVAVIQGSYTGLSDAVGVAINPVNGDIYAANGTGGPGGTGSITIYSPGSNGNVPPIGTITGSLTGLDNPQALALDAGGEIYVPNFGTSSTAGSVTVYAAGTTGNAAPVQSISGTKTRLSEPYQVAVDSSSDIYVTNNASKTVTVYAAGTNGNTSPIRKITSGKFTDIYGVALDSANATYVSNSANYTYNYVLTFAAGANGRAMPVGKRTGTMYYPEGIAIR